MITCFEMSETPYYPGKYMIDPVHDNFYLHRALGSYNIIGARLLNLTYAQYLRFCRDICGATIIGKGHRYPVPYFENNDKLKRLVKILNRRANMILNLKKDMDISGLLAKDEKELRELMEEGNVSN